MCHVTVELMSTVDRIVDILFLIIVAKHNMQDFKNSCLKLIALVLSLFSARKNSWFSRIGL